MKIGFGGMPQYRRFLSSCVIEVTLYLAEQCLGCQ